MSAIALTGCRPEPLAAYLKALGVLRLVAEQADPTARGAWTGGSFQLDSTLDEAELVRFFTEKYVPTPIITPWNGGSGFWPTDKPKGIDPIRHSTDPRLEPYRRAIATADALVARSGLSERPEKAEKAGFVSRLRARLDDDALPWLDAALVFTAEALEFPPLLGTGGNDGHLDFANHFMQRVAELLLAGSRPTESPIRSALFGEPTHDLGPVNPGQFLPAAGKGYNNGIGFEGTTGASPWDFVLMLEGAVAFATATVKRLESGEGRAMSSPFTVRPIAAGFGSSASRDTKDSHGEMWFPLWSRPASAPEVLSLLREGRVRVGRRSVANGTDFARAIAALSVDRGLSGFARYGFHMRNGRSYQAVPLGRWRVGDRPAPLTGALDAIDAWLVDLSRNAGPARLGSAIRAVQASILGASRSGSGPTEAQAVLCALADVEAAAVDSREHGGLWRPVPRLETRLWDPSLDDGTAEFALAAALAPGLRNRWSAVRGGGPSWCDEATRPRPAARVWRRGVLEERLLDLMAREEAEAEGDAPHPAARAPGAPLWAVDRFLAGATDDARIAELARALSLLDGPVHVPARPDLRTTPSFAFAAARLVAAGAVHLDGVEVPIPRVAGWLAAARRGDGPAFSRLTLRRLAASRVPVRGLGRHTRPELLSRGDHWPARRLAAACRFPLSNADLLHLQRAVAPEEQP
jgi:CRISPR-associated protein Csx17